jgi:hypothetical protein
MLVISNHAAFAVVSIVYHSLLSEIEGFEVLAAVAVTSINQTEEATSGRIS